MGYQKNYTYKLCTWQWWEKQITDPYNDARHVVTQHYGGCERECMPTYAEKEGYQINGCKNCNKRDPKQWMVADCLFFGPDLDRTNLDAMLWQFDNNYTNCDDLTYISNTRALWNALAEEPSLKDDWAWEGEGHGGYLVIRYKSAKGKLTKMFQWIWEYYYGKKYPNNGTGWEGSYLDHDEDYRSDLESYAEWKLVRDMVSDHWRCDNLYAEEPEQRWLKDYPTGDFNSYDETATGTAGEYLNTITREVICWMNEQEESRFCNWNDHVASEMWVKDETIVDALTAMGYWRTDSTEDNRVLCPGGHTKGVVLACCEGTGLVDPQRWAQIKHEGEVDRLAFQRQLPLFEVT